MTGKHRGKRTSKDQDVLGSHRSEQMPPEFHQAFCALCGSLGNYARAVDASNAETLHQNTKHSASVPLDVQQNEINKHGEAT